MTPIALLAVAVFFGVGSVLLSVYTSRRMSRGEWRFAPRVVAPRLAIYTVVLGIGIRMSADQPLTGIPFTLFALAMLAFWLRAGITIARAARSGKTPEQLADEMSERMVEPLALYGVLVLLVAFLGVIGLFVFGVAERLG